MKNIRVHFEKLKGFTLVELMIAITISSIIMLGVVSLYSSTRKSQIINESLARIQENLRFSADMIIRDIRMAGYSGCRSSSVTNTIEDNPPTLPYDFQKHVTGFESADVPGEFPSVGTNPGERVDNTDAIVIIKVSSKGFKIVSHNSSSATIFFDAAGAGIEKGDVLAITDCNHTAITRVSGPTNPNQHVVHNTGAQTAGPKNCWKKLGPETDPAPSCGASNGTSYTYGDNARVHKYIMHGYFIGVSRSGLTTSLYILNLDKGLLSSTELVEGIENFQVTYGIDPDLTDSNPFPVRFLKASDVTDFKKVVAVKFGMLLASVDDAKKVIPTTAKSYTLADTVVTPTADKKLRFSYNTTVKIRNKGIR